MHNVEYCCECAVDIWCVINYDDNHDTKHSDDFWKYMHFLKPILFPNTDIWSGAAGSLPFALGALCVELHYSRSQHVVSVVNSTTSVNILDHIIVEDHEDYVFLYTFSRQSIQ